MARTTTVLDALPQDLPYNIAPRVQAALERSGLSQAQVARQAGMTRAQLWKILTGKRATVHAETLRRLALALDCRADYLLGLRDTPAARR